MGAFRQGRLNQSSYFALLAFVFALIVLAAVFLPKPPPIAEFIIIFVGVPRLHDTGRSAWWLLIPFVLEFGGLGLLIAYAPMEQFMLYAGLITLGLLAMMIGLGLLPGEKDANDYGPPTLPGFSFGKTE